MAIIKMKGLHLFVPRKRKRELLRDLMRLGCVHIDEPPDWMADKAYAARFVREDVSQTEGKTKQALLKSALAVIDRVAPQKKPLLSPKPEMPAEQFFDGEGVERAIEKAQLICAQAEREKQIAAEISEKKSLLAMLEPWLGLDLRLDQKKTEKTVICPVTFSARSAWDELNAALCAVCEEAELFSVSLDSKLHYALLIAWDGRQDEIIEGLRPYEFAFVNLKDLHDTPLAESDAAKRQIAALQEEKEACLQRIKEAAAEREEMQKAHDKIGVSLMQSEANANILCSEKTAFLQGWVPAQKEEALAKLLDTYGCAYEFIEPSEEDYPRVPVGLRNNRITNALNMVTNMYSLPSYGTVDPNPLMAPFFILFYGLMMADIGYGILMILAALIAMRKLKPREGTLSFCQLLLYSGISTTVMGALTGACFGDAPYQLVHIFHPESTWQGLPYLFSPVHDSSLVLYGAMGLGMLHLNTGMAVSFYRKVKAGKVADAIFEEGALWAVLITGVLAVFQIGLIGGIPVLLLAAVLMLLFGAGRHEKGFGKITAAFSCIYNTATGWFGDVLSYARIMALMLAGGVVAQVFNTIAAMPANGSGVNPLTITLFFLIALVGHLLNFGLNLLGCFVHDLRLQCLEFFGKFYEDGGKPYRPLKVSGTYLQTKE